MHLTLALLLDEAYGTFSKPPPQGALLEVEDLERQRIPAAEWELDKMWQETLQGLPTDFNNIECSVHEKKADCDGDHSLDQVSKSIIYEYIR